METVKQVNIKNRTYYFTMILLIFENFDSSLLKLDKKSYKGIGIYNIEYISQLQKLVIVKIFKCESFIFTYYPCKQIYLAQLR